LELLRLAIDSKGRTIWIADAHRDDGKRFVLHAQGPDSDGAIAGLNEEQQKQINARFNRAGAVHNQPSHFTVWRLFVSRTTL